MVHSHSTDVEVIVVDDPWAEFGSALPELPSGQQEQDSTHHSRLRRWPIWSAAALFTIALHTLLLGTLILGSPARKHQIPMTEGASAQSNDAIEFISHLVLIKDSSITTPDTQDDSAYAVSTPATPEPVPLPDFAILTAMPQVQIEIAGVDDGADTTASTPDAQGDAAGRAMLFGRYMGQIKARIERAWTFPTNATAASFKCTVQIKQSKRGEVQEVTMQHCDPVPAWQLSLAKAIQAASPLSAPPDKQVFSEVITLTFDESSHLQN